jgi:hypothetical protein
MAQHPHTVHVEDILLDEARHMGRVPRIDLQLDDPLRQQFSRYPPSRRVSSWGQRSPLKARHSALLSVNRSPMAESEGYLGVSL